jgi:nucleoside-diphosphate-sugar epimerase
MTQRALLVGGAGATGRYLASGLADRGYEVTILHRGVHEPEHLAPYRHIHADPHFAESVKNALEDETFDAVLLTYGRIEQLARIFAGRCERLISVGGIPIYGGFADPSSCMPSGTPIMVGEDGAPAELSAFSDPKAAAFVAKMAAAENAVIDAHNSGAYRATVIRYPRIYGIGNVVSQEWSVVRRVLDGRRFLLLPNGAKVCFTRCAAANAAHCVLLALESEAAAGVIFNCGDDEQFSLKQWAEIVLDAIGGSLELVGLPTGLNHVASHFALYGGSMFSNALVSTQKARSVLGYRDVVGARQAIADCTRWWVENAASGGQDMIQRDAFDYDLEDRVHDRLAGLAEAFPPVARADVPFHSYAHPRQPSLGSDHMGI